jgi:hypothetical protein
LENKIDQQMVEFVEDCFSKYSRVKRGEDDDNDLDNNNNNKLLEEEDDTAGPTTTGGGGVVLAEAVAVATALARQGVAKKKTRGGC